MASDLQQKLPVSPLLQQHALSGTLDRQTTQDKRSRGKAQVLSAVLAIDSHELDCFCLPKFPFKNQQVAGQAPSDGLCRLETVQSSIYLSKVCEDTNRGRDPLFVSLMCHSGLSTPPASTRSVALSHWNGVPSDGMISLRC